VTSRSKKPSAVTPQLGDQAIYKDSYSHIESLPSDASDDLIGLSDIPIMKIGDSGPINPDEAILGKERKLLIIPASSKPQGSAYISVKMSIGTSNTNVVTDLCVDT
jgi:hypothetical protein